MTRYKQAQFADEDSSSIGSIQINETTRSPTMHIRYHTARGTSLWHARSKLEKVLLLLLLGSLVTIVVLASILATESTRILHVQPHVDSNIYKGESGLFFLFFCGVVQSELHGNRSYQFSFCRWQLSTEFNL